MKALHALLGDRKRAQRGSVLSGVLIIVAFLAIISGALMTELSTNLLLSRALVHRVGNEATLNSAMERALDQLQATALINGCPSLSPVNLNGRTAAISYTSCFPAVDTATQPQFTTFDSSSPFNIDGTHDVVNGQDLYLVGDSNGNVYQFRFGSTSPLWSRNLRSQVTGPPLMMPDGSNRISDLIPLSGSACQFFSACVELLTQSLSGSPFDSCVMRANASVTAQPAAGVAFPGIAFFGDRNGTLFAYAATQSGNCDFQDSATISGSSAIVAGPVVFRNGTRDEVFVVTSRGASAGQLLRFDYRGGFNPSLTAAGTLTLPFANPVGLAIEKTTSTTEKTTLPVRLAITFAGGQVAMARIDTSFNLSILATATLGAGVARAPHWCWCAGANLIGVAGLNGTLYVRDDSNLGAVASYAGGSPLRTTPASDGVGDWFVGADDGLLHEVQQLAGQPTMVQRATYGQGGARVGSSVQVGTCTIGICAYMGALDSNAYIVALDARKAILTACLSTTPPACSSDQPPVVDAGGGGGCGESAHGSRRGLVVLFPLTRAGS